MRQGDHSQACWRFAPLLHDRNVWAGGLGPVRVPPQKPHCIRLFSSRKVSEVILEFPKGLADQAYLPDRHLLILPESIENKLTAYDMSGLLP